jgi:hypothetical protein
VILEYAGAGYESLVIAQGDASGGSCFGTISDSPFTPIMIGTEQAAWYPASGILVWEHAGISCTLGAHGITEAEALRIAQSMR